MGKGIRAMIVPEGHSFPAQREARCCGKKVRVGESVLAIPVKSGDLVVQVVMHRSCLLKFTEHMPLGREEAQSAFDKLKADIIRTGRAIPD